MLPGIFLKTAMFCCACQPASVAAFDCSVLTCREISPDMARFRVAGSPKPKAGAPVPEPREVAISTIVSGNMPLGHVSVRGRIVALFPPSEKYPFRKFLDWQLVV